MHTYTYTVVRIHNKEAAVRSCSVKKVFLEISQNSIKRHFNKRSIQNKTFMFEGYPWFSNNLQLNYSFMVWQNIKLPEQAEKLIFTFSVLLELKNTLQKNEVFC